MMERVAILGTGLLGTSVGLALRAAGFQRIDRRLESQSGRRTNRLQVRRYRFALRPIRSLRHAKPT